MSKEIYIDFREAAPVGVVSATSAGLATAAADTTTSNFSFGKHQLEVYYEAANSDMGFTRNAAGVVIPNDNVDNEGVEITPGVLANADFPGHFKIGTDAAFKLWLKFKIPDVSDYDVSTVGFRKAAAAADIATPAAQITAYTDCAALGVNAGAIYTYSRLNSGTGVATDTTDTVADGVEVTLEVLVSAAGVVTFEIDGAAPTVTQAVTFDDTDIVIPYIHFTKGAAAADTPPILKELFVGYQ